MGLLERLALEQGSGKLKLLDAFDRHKSHVGAGDGFTDRSRISGIVLARLPLMR